MTSIWKRAAVARIAVTPQQQLPIVGPCSRTVPGFDLWDFWPLQQPDGQVAMIDGGELWFSLSAPAEGAPVLRHGRARLRLLRRAGGNWHDLGNALPDGLSPGSREWSGSAILDPRQGYVNLYFTAAGRRGEAQPTYRQRIFETRGLLAPNGRITGWSLPDEAVVADGGDYVVTDQADGMIGTIKAFRDPSWFRDPADGSEYLLFSASLAQSVSAFNGAVGIAGRTAGAWCLRPPLIHADDLNNELERPHIVVRDGCYYLFWSTQASVFAPDLVAPTGLYGMVSDTLRGNYRPLNGSGLVAANPGATPSQAYSWLVLPNLKVSSFVDQIAPGRAGFGGCFAPEFQLRLKGDRSWIV